MVKRTNTVADALNTGKAMLDLGGGLPAIPLPVDGIFDGGPGPKGEGVPDGGSPLQVIRKNSSGTTTEWVTPTKSFVGLPNVDNTSDVNKPVSTATQTALDTKASKIELGAKADLVAGKVPVEQIPTSALVTDTTVSAQVNAPLTGGAIDSRISTQVAPQVNQLVADAIASDQTIIDAAASAVDASPKIATLEAKNVSQDAAIVDAKPYKGGLPLNARLVDYTESSWYAVSSSTAALGMQPALPVEYANIGVLEILRGSSGGYRSYRWTVIGGGQRGVLQNDYQNGVWTGWRRLDYDPRPRTVPNGANIDTYIRDSGKFDGSWVSLNDAVSAGITGLPEGETGLFFLEVLGGTGHQVIQFYNGGMYRRGINSVSGGTLGSWVRLDQEATATTAFYGPEERAVRVARSKQRVGGRIGTSGKPVFALRFDDWADDMQNTAMPELRLRNLCAGWAATVAYVENPSQGLPQTWPVVGEWVRDGIELMGHSWTHVNASGDANIRKEVIESADYIESKVPAAAIDTWCMPGLTPGDASYDGFGIGNKIENFYSKPAGRMILQRYPIVGGAVPGRYLPLVGEPSIGRVHLTIDTLTAASVIADMEKARDAGVGFQLMCHPIHIGKTDKITLADFRAILDWLATERDAGRVEVLTPRGIAYADKSSTDWLNTVPNVDQWTGWGSRTDWTAEAGYITTTIGGVMVRAINMTSYGYLRGGIVEIAARVRTPTGAVVRTGITGGAERTADHTMPASTDWKWVRTVATIPNNLADSASLVASIGRVSGGQVDIDFMAVRPV